MRPLRSHLRPEIPLSRKSALRAPAHSAANSPAVQVQQWADQDEWADQDAANRASLNSLPEEHMVKVLRPDGHHDRDHASAAQDRAGTGAGWIGIIRRARPEPDPGELAVHSEGASLSDAAEQEPKRVLERRKAARARAQAQPDRPLDPAPSRLAYRLHRLWLTPLFRLLLRVGLPAFVIVFALGAVVSDAERRAAMVGLWNNALDAIEARPEFQITRMDVQGASDTVAAALLALGPEVFPVSSFRLKLDELRAVFEGLDAVERADLRLRSGGVLEVRVRERVPAIIWQSREGLEILDAGGHRIGYLRQRAARPDLPLIGGDGGNVMVAEALALFSAAQLLGDDLSGMVRVGERRWDVVLENGPRIQLPETGAMEALERVIALHQTQELLDRDIAAVDMRNPARPTLRLTEPAISELRRMRALNHGAAIR